MGGPCSLGWVHDRCEGAGDDHALDGWGALFDGLEDTRCSNDGGVKEVFLGVRDVVVERGRSVNYSFERWIGFDDFVKGVWFGDVFDDDKVELGSGDIGMVLENILTLLLGADGGDDRVALF